MSLVGRLEDLPVSDILRIVYLSRGTGALEVLHNGGRHEVMFRRGLIVNASAPADPSLRWHLEQKSLEMASIAPPDLAKLVFDRISGLVKALNDLRNGEFRFRAVEATPAEIGYNPQALFRHGGIQPEKILGKGAMQLRALNNLKETIDAGRRATERPAEAAPAPKPDKGTVVLLEDDAQILETLRDALTRRGFQVVMCTREDARTSVDAFLAEERFFVAALDIEATATQQIAWRVLDSIKARNPRVPVIIIDREASVRRRHTAIQAGADLYLTKPIASDDVALFAEDVVVFAGRQFQRAAEAQSNPRGAAADKERMYRGFSLLMRLIGEVSEPNDISQLALTILQLAADYVDRGILFAVTPTQFATIGRFGLTANGAGVRVARGAMSVLDRVVETRQPYRANVDMAAGDHQLLNAFGGQPPSEIVVLPIMNGDQIVGLLYGDNALNQRTIDDTVGLEVFLSQAGSVFQNAMTAGQTRGAIAASW
jgi:ActR/RegA family two-component response regulator